MGAVRAMRGYAALACLVPLLAHLLLPAAAARRVSVVAMALTGVLVLLAVGVGAWRQRRTRGPLGLTFAASCAWVLGEAMTGAGAQGSPLAWAGIGLNVAGYALVAFALARVGRIHHSTNEPDSWADAAVLVLVCALGAWWLVAVLGIGAPERSGAATVARWTLLVGDIVLLGACLRLVTLVPARSASMRSATVAAVLLALGDIASLWGPVDRAAAPALAVSLWIASWACFGQFALDPSADELLTPAPEDDGRRVRPIAHRRVALLFGLCAVPGILLLVTAARGRVGLRDGGPIALAMAAVFVVLLARLVAAVRRVQAVARELAVLADHDELTGLANRRAAERAFAAVSRRRDGEGTPLPLALAIVDLDHFKRFNDTRGHQQGDRLLRGAAQQWAQRLGPDIVLTRHGGEEFLVIAPDHTPEQLRTRVDAMRGGTPSRQTFSAGVAAWRPGESLDALVARADRGLYTAKSAGRSRAVVVREGPEQLDVDGPALQPSRSRRLWLPAVLSVVAAGVLTAFALCGGGVRFTLYLLSLAVTAVGVVLGPLRQVPGHRVRGPWLVALGVVWGLFLVSAVWIDPQVVAGASLSTLAAVGLHVVVIPLVLTLHAGHDDDRTAWIDAAIVVCCLLLAMTVLLGTAETAQRSLRVLGQAWVTPVYQMTSALTLGLLVQAVLSRRRPPTVLLLLLAASAAQLLGDIAVALHPSRTFPDAPWAFLQMSTLLLIGVAASVPSAARLARPERRDSDIAPLGRLRTAMLAVAAVVPGGLLLDALAHQGASRGEAAVIALAYLLLLALVVARVAGLLALQRRLAERLDQAARTDPLTGLDNRRSAAALLDRLCEPDVVVSTDPSDWPQVSIAVIDLDHFKRYNDEHGHAAGDALLTQTAARWLGCLGPDDRLHRVGGEEFLLVGPGHSVEAMLALTDELGGAVPDGQTLSAGVAQWDGVESVEHLIGRADAALYRAKEEGRARSVSADPRVQLRVITTERPETAG